MKRLLPLAILLLAVRLASGSDLVDAARAARARREAAATTLITLKVAQSQSLQMPGATAAWAIDESIVDVSAHGGRVLLLGRTAGRTNVRVLSSAGEQSLHVVVETAVSKRSLAGTNAQPANHGSAEVRYSSAAHEIQNAVTMSKETRNRKTEIEARTVHQTGGGNRDRPSTSIVSASYRVFTGKRELTLFDRNLDHSPLTLSNTPVRGLHYLDDSWRLHAGYTAYAIYRSFLIPVERQHVAGGGYRFRTGAHSSLTPSLFAYRGEGTVASMLYAFDDSDGLAWRAEVGFSKGLGVAGDVAYDKGRDHVRAELRYRPDEFAAVHGSPRGFFSDAYWSHEYRGGSNAALTFAASDVAGARILAGSADSDHRLSESLSVTGGVSWGSFSSANSLTVPAGIRIELPHASIGALYRYAYSSTNEGGHGVRLSARGSRGAFYASAYVDRQQNAPTLDVILSERPDLALALQELGITATSPADIARALREQAALADLGFIQGVTIDLAPMRTQFGCEVAWLGGGPSRQQLRARLLRNVVETVSQRTASTIATLSWSRSLGPATDLFASYSYWRTERRGAEAQVQPFVEAGVRQRFDGLPSFLDRGGAISGVVFADENLDGRSDGVGVRAIVELDGLRTEATGSDGAFRFTGVSSGPHRLAVTVPDRPDAYFTTPSRVETNSGDSVSFGVASTPARLNGTVTSDSGAGIAGVRLLLAHGNDQVVATTDSDGRFAMASAPGEWTLSILTDSLPAGFSATGTEGGAVHLDRTSPLSRAFVLRAQRSIIGSGAAPNAPIQVHPLSKTIHADDSGHFALRSLAPGELTLVSGSSVQTIVVPNEPGAHQVDFAPRIAGATALPSVRKRVTDEVRESMHGYVVQIGVYRMRSNAVETLTRARRSGVDATMIMSGPLTIVRAGPYQSEKEAASTAASLIKDGFDAVVMTAK